MAKKGRIPGRRYAGEHGKPDEAGAEDAAPDGRTGKEKWKQKNLQLPPEAGL